MTLDSKSPSQRVKYGVDLETMIIECLNNKYSDHGYNLQSSTHQEDCEEKVDCWQIGKNGKKYKSAIKVRISKDDILVSMRDPFYGLFHEDTKIGRDIVCEYFQYITLSKDGETIRVANGKTIHSICQAIWQELLDQKQDIDLSLSKKSRLLLSSTSYPGCELWLHYDRWKGTPKILGFIPPSILKENKDIKYHKLIKEQ